MRSQEPIGRRLAARLAVVGLAAVFVAGIWLSAGTALGLVYAPLCHQMAERSFAWNGETCAVCARCSGLYLGGLAGLALAAGGRLRQVTGNLGLRLLILTAAPTVVDFAFGLVGAPSLGRLGRTLLALPPGLIAGLLLSGAVADIVGRAPGLFGNVRTPEEIR